MSPEPRHLAGERRPAAPSPESLLLVATSARALAESAVRGGFRVRSLDGFCDQDTLALGPCTRLPLLSHGGGLGLDPAALRTELRGLAGCAPDLGLVYGSGLESAPQGLSDLPSGVRLLGNDPALLSRLGDPVRFLQLLDGLAIPHPHSRLTTPHARDPARWLVKVCGGSGGQGVREWRPAQPLPASPHYFQRFQSGTPMSLLFVADGVGCEVVGWSRLLVTGEEPGSAFLYGGAIGPATPAARPRREVTAWARALTRELGLRGLSNLDFILSDRRAWLLELNPRPSATISLHEARYATGLMQRHVSACLEGPRPMAAQRAAGVLGQRVLYAPADLTVPADLGWPDWCRDRPAAGARIRRGEPVCTLLADGPNAVRVEALLADRGASLLTRLTGQPG